MSKVIIIDTKENSSKLNLIKILNDEEGTKVLLAADVFIGRNGTTYYKKEGDGKTPLGKFAIGIAFGKNDRKNINLDNSIEYITINKNLYWVDDVNSKYYNKLVDITKVDVDWRSAEHLSEYLLQYEYAIEVKVNPKNIPGKGSAIFIHCSNGTKTAGCIALQREKMIKLLAQIDKYTEIIIK